MKRFKDGLDCWFYVQRGELRVLSSGQVADFRQIQAELAEVIRAVVCLCVQPLISLEFEFVAAYFMLFHGHGNPVFGSPSRVSQAHMLPFAGVNFFHWCCRGVHITVHDPLLLPLILLLLSHILDIELGLYCGPSIEQIALAHELDDVARIELLTEEALVVAVEDVLDPGFGDVCQKRWRFTQRVKLAVHLLLLKQMRGVRYAYRTLVKDMECRKEIIKKIEKPNKKAYQNSLPFGERIIYKAKDNKKKLIFFILVAALGVFYDYHKKFYYWITRMQPFSNKIDRWIFGIQNKIPKTVKQQDLRQFSLGQTIRNRLLQAYFDLDRKLYYGVGRHMLFEVYGRMGLLEKDDEKRTFLLASGYQKERNQKIAGVTSRDFLIIFDEGFKKFVKFNPTATPQGFLEQFLSEMNKQLPIEQVFQINTSKEWKEEYFNVRYRDTQKQVLISEALSKDPYLPYQKIIQKTENNGLRALATNDRHLIVNTRLIDKILQRHFIKKKLASVTNTSKVDKKFKYQRQLKEVNAEIDKLKAEQDKLEADYHRYYSATMF